jgi:hypothetical protein
MEKQDNAACRHETSAVLNTGGDSEEVARVFIARVWLNGNNRFLSAQLGAPPPSPHGITALQQ